MAFRPYYIAREWIKEGHSVTIVGASFSHLRIIQPNLCYNYQIENFDGIKYIWLKTPSYKSNYKRILNILAFILRLSHYANKILREAIPDIVIASSTYPLDIYTAHRIAVKTKARLCFEVHDLWPLSPMVIGGYSRWHPFIMIMQLAENYAYKRSDIVISLLDKALPHMVKHGLKPEKFIVIPNGYFAEEWNNNNEELPSEHRLLFSKFRNENRTIVGYAGGHSPSNALDTLLNAAKLLNKRPDIVFVLVGEGPSKNELIQEANSADQKNVHFLPSVTKRAIPDLIKRFDIAYMGGVKSILHKYGTSYNKMTDYMLSARPIIFAVDEPDSLIERLGCGITVPAERPDRVSDAVERIITYSASERMEMGLRGKAYVEKELKYEILSKKMLNYISCLENKP
jgi:glycosyltransferase involved in cell wall biosynthesis